MELEKIKRKQQLNYILKACKKRKERKEKAIRFTILKKSADIRVPSFLTFIRKLVRKKKIDEPYRYEYRPINPKLTEIAKYAEQGENNDPDERVSPDDDDAARLIQEQAELREEFDRRNSTDEAPFLFKENTYVLTYSPQFKYDDERETEFNFCLLDCHKMEWKTLDIAVDWHFDKMIIMDDQIYFLDGESFFKLNLETMKTKQLPSLKHSSIFYNNYLVVNNCFWIFGGWNEDEKPVKYVEMYNPVTNEWIEKPPLRYEREDAKCATVNDKIFVCGGWGLRTIEVFDLNSETWTLLNTKLPFDSTRFRVAALDNFLIFCTVSESKTITWKLNVGTLEWTELPSISYVNQETELIEIDNKLVHFGQIKIDDGIQNEPKCVDIFDGQRWRKGPSLYYETYFFCNAVVRSPTLIDKMVSLAIEEEEQVSLSEMDRVYSTDEAPFLFKEDTYVLVYSSSFTYDDERLKEFNFCLLDCHKMEWKTLDIPLDWYFDNMIIMDDQIYFLFEESFFKLNLETMETEQLPPMKRVIRYDYYLVVNNCLWIFGGEDQKRKPVNYAEMYDPVTNEWIEKPSLLGERWKPRCATVNDKIFVCGGWELDEWLRTIEVFDLNSETWTLLNTEIPFDSIYFRVAALDNFLMFCKRTVSKTKIWKLNLDTLEWTELPSISGCTSRRELIGIEDKLVHIGKVHSRQDEKEPICIDIFDGQRWIQGPSGNIGTRLLNNVVLRSPTLIDKMVSLAIEE